MVTAEEQYKKYPQIDRSEVLKIMEWFEKQPHLPKVTGTLTTTLICTTFGAFYKIGLVTYTHVTILEIERNWLFMITTTKKRFRKPT